MLFNSYTFIFLFLPLAWVGFYAVARVLGARAARVWLLLVSLGFYAWWNPVHLPLLLGSIVANHVWAERMARVGSRRVRWWMMMAGVSVNVGLLAWFKYADFVLRSTLGTLGYEVEATGIMIPLAISFFTFQQIAYIVDAYREPSPGRPLLDYAVFVSFFPQLVAGPIIHHREMMPQLATGTPYSARARNVAVGLTMFAMGLFKKVVIADELAQYPEAVFGAAAQGDAPSAVAAWIGTLGFTLQVYFDFSGYSDMALGLARMFGLRLPMNFDSPLKATTISELWRRWHITLSRFLRAYVYVPLGGSRAGMGRHHVNVVLTMLVCGIWHGAAWTFVAFGLLHGIYLIVQHHWSKRFRLRHDAPGWRRAFRCGWARVMTFMAFAFSLVLFRSSDFASAWLVFSAMVGIGDGGVSGGDAGAGIDVVKAGAWIGVAWAIAWTMPNVQEFLRREEPALDWTPSRTKWRFGSRHVAYPAWSPRVGWAVVVVGMTVWSVLNLDRVAIFVYWQF
ncbi:MBOAT family O-acyltransferase [Nodularia spumigena]|uniref:MBOAT family O-acyltransferase n=1 Tax=Nodularia spumigena TaxID=70799 RepID=UPI002B213404|nr:MBOAT family protein [Nodularia spumigena]MEA5557587.1 MBOAT family protein [Nodularia spumigena CH309]